ncbi:MAG TPA: hypothetical protein VLL05_10655 [Terriglobales bacterium]|nr:hypothetical protein [Terriglobales bacterium]
MVLPLSLLFHYPVVVFTRLVTGWIASLICLGYAVLNLFVGRGLLKLRPWARQAAIGLYAFGFVNMAVFYLAPGARGRVEALLESQTSTFWWEKMLPNQAQVHIDPAPLLPVFAVIGLIGVAVPIYFLVTRKAAFVSDGE